MIGCIDEHLGECYAESQSTKGGDSCEPDILQLDESCSKRVSQSSTSRHLRAPGSMRTDSARYQNEVFNRVRTRVQHVLSFIPEAVLEFDRSEEDSVSKVIGEVHWP